MENFLIVLVFWAEANETWGLSLKNLEMPWRHRQIGQRPGSLSSTEIGF